MANAVIVGAGVAGLTAGIRLRQAGVDCLILEKHTRPGGELTAWRRGAYLIDNCMHWLNGTLPGTRQNDLWRAVGMLDDRTALCRSETFFQCRLCDETLAFGRDTALLRRRMHELSPVDKKEIDALIDAVEAMASVFAPRDRRLLKRAASAVGTAGVMASLYVRYGTKSLFDLASRFRHPLLRMGLTGFLGGAFSAFAWLYAYGAFVAGDADVPAGGSGEAAERMARRYAELGGELR
ncbi:MAG: NAD(P)-binding protein, partial [Clostridia bacterium]|nr:NAD(P)-binding protein [Clostridia bacterium]